MRIGVNGRATWSAVVALVAGLSAGGTRMASAQDPVDGVALAVAGPRFLALEASRSSDTEPRWTDASNAAVFRKAISVDLRDVSLAEALAVIAQRAGLRLTYSGSLRAEMEFPPRMRTMAPAPGWPLEVTTSTPGARPNSA